MISSKLRTSQAIKSELIDLVQRGGVLEVILNNVDVVGSGQKTSKLGSLGVPQRG